MNFLTIDNSQLEEIMVVNYDGSGLVWDFPTNQELVDDHFENSVVGLPLDITPQEYYDNYISTGKSKYSQFFECQFFPAVIGIVAMCGLKGTYQGITLHPDRVIIGYL